MKLYSKFIALVNQYKFKRLIVFVSLYTGDNKLLYYSVLNVLYQLEIRSMNQLRHANLSNIENCTRADESTIQTIKYLQGLLRIGGVNS